MNILKHMFGRIVLFPYELILRTRNYLFDRGILKAYQSGIPVISVGNLTVGGTGKTPLVQYIAKLLLVDGTRPVVLSRGYGGSFSGEAHFVSEADSAGLVGDEPLLHFNRGIPTVIARRRAAGMALIEQRCAEKQMACDVIILDDGFQHRRVNRNLNLLAVYAQELETFSVGGLFPFGIFREPRSAGLRRAQAAVVSTRTTTFLDAQHYQQWKNALPETAPIFECRISTVTIRKNAQVVSPQEVDIFVALANPEAFRATLTALGFSIRHEYRRPDHQPLSSTDLATFLSAAEARPLLCSEKDFVKIPREMQGKVGVAAIEIEVRPEADFLRLLRTAVSSPGAM